MIKDYGCYSYAIADSQRKDHNHEFVYTPEPPLREEVAFEIRTQLGRTDWQMLACADRIIERVKKRHGII